MLHLFKKSTALLLVISMLLGVLCLPAFAVEAQGKLEYLFSSTDASSGEKGIYAGSAVGSPTIPKPEEGYTHVYLGGGNMSNYWSGFTFKDDSRLGYTDKYGTSHYVRDTYTRFAGAGCLFDGIYVTHLDKGQYVTEYLTIGNGIDMNPKYVKNAAGIPVRYGAVEQFVMADTENKQYITTYCADQSTPAAAGCYYNIVNLEDSTYYNPSQAAMIRTIAMNGYWGDNNLKMGSLGDFKAMLAASEKFTTEEIASVTDGMAMAATQYAIWSFSNHQSVSLVQIYYGIPEENLPFKGKPEMVDDEWVVSKDAEEIHKKETDLIFRIYNHLINMAPTPVENGNTGEVILNKDNVLKDLRIFANAIFPNHPNNLDAVHDNDAYFCDLSFKMLVSPNVEQDDLVVRVYDEQGNLLALGRIAGELQEGEIPLEGDKNGCYTFHNLVLTEGTSELDISLEGTQRLNRGVYLYTAEEREIPDHGRRCRGYSQG